MQYLTYEEYKKIGGTLEQTAFDRIIIRACGDIDNHTNGRIRAMEKIPDEVKCLCADLVDFYSQNTSSGLTITSKSVSAGPVSESETYSAKSSEDVSYELDALFASYLGNIADDNGTPLLYRGCSI